MMNNEERKPFKPRQKCLRVEEEDHGEPSKLSVSLYPQQHTDASENCNDV